MSGPMRLSDTGGEPGGEAPRMPRWVKVSVTLVGALVLLVLLLRLAGVGGDHRPGRHGSASAALGALQVRQVAGDEPPAGRGTTARGHG